MTLTHIQTRFVQIACDAVPLRYKDETLDAFYERFVAWQNGPYSDLCEMLLKAENNGK